MKWLVARLLNRRGHREFIQATRDPRAATERFWAETRAELLNGVHWRGRLSPTSSYRDFPISTYEDYRDSIERSFRSGISELTGAPVRFWCESSGTSGTPKYFPVTDTYLEQIQRTTKAFSYAVAGVCRWRFNQPIVYFAATRSHRFSPSGVEIGFISGHIYRSLPPLIRRSYALPVEVFESDERFFEWGPLYAMARDISGLFATIPSLVTRYAERIEARGLAEYLPILRGEKPWPAGLPPVRVGSARLRRIERALAKRPFDFRDLWPSLSLITTWKSSVCAWQLPALQRYNRSRVMIVDGFYSATEGWVGVSLMREGTGSVCHPLACLVEFCEEGVEPSPDRLKQSWELEVGKRYEIFFTQSMGLIRYRIHDVVECTGFYNRSPIIEFQYKSGNVLSLGQTRFRDSHLLEAIEATGFEPRGSWAFGPSAEGDRLCFYTDSDEEAGSLDRKLAALERELRKKNPEIDQDLASGVIKPMKFHRLPPDHPVWASMRHAQGKQKVLLKVPYDQEEPR